MFLLGYQRKTKKKYCKLQLKKTMYTTELNKKNTALTKQYFFCF